MKYVFTDMHHSDLLYSLQLLFEKRLGYTLFRPIGLEWWKEGYWKIYDHPDTANQYLNLEQGYKPKDGSLPLNQIYNKLGVEILKDKIYYCKDLHNDTLNKAITLDTFKEMDIDIVIASIPAHIEPFKRLAKMKNAKFIFQMGNMFSEVINHIEEIPNLLSSTIEFNVSQSVNAVFYHQEFDLDIFKPDFSRKVEKNIYSFINCFGTADIFVQDWVTFRQIEGLMPDWSFKSFGGSCRDGSVGSTIELAGKIQEAAFIWHTKKHGDGFGHIFHNAFACGKPVITNFEDYKDKLGGKLLVDMTTSIDISKHSVYDIQEILADISPHEYEYMTQQAYNRFKEVVDFNAEFEEIKVFLNNLK